jgi:hypothetical protein
MVHKHVPYPLIKILSVLVKAAARQNSNEMKAVDKSGTQVSRQVTCCQKSSEAGCQILYAAALSPGVPLMLACTHACLCKGCWIDAWRRWLPTGCNLDNFIHELPHRAVACEFLS